MRENCSVFADFHVHAPYCGHAQGTIIDYVEAALARGITTLCVTDHLGRYYLSPSQKKRYWDWGMNSRNLHRYVSELEHVKKTYAGRITVLSGLEIDYIEGAEDLIPPQIDKYSFDFLLGSIHCLPRFGWKHIAKYQERDMWPIFSEYFRTAKKLVTCGLFNSFAHIDFIWRYARWPARYSLETFRLIEEVVAEASAHDVAIELNTNGYLWSQIYTVMGGDPFEILLRSIKKHAAFITVGSDAHKPEFVGKSFRELAHLLRIMGIDEYATFEKGRRKVHPVP